MSDSTSPPDVGSSDRNLTQCSSRAAAHVPCAAALPARDPDHRRRCVEVPAVVDPRQSSQAQTEHEELRQHQEKEQAERESRAARRRRPSRAPPGGPRRRSGLAVPKGLGERRRNRRRLTRSAPPCRPGRVGSYRQPSAPPFAEGSAAEAAPPVVLGDDEQPLKARHGEGVRSVVAGVESELPPLTADVDIPVGYCRARSSRFLILRRREPKAVNGMLGSRPGSCAGCTVRRRLGESDTRGHDPVIRARLGPEVADAGSLSAVRGLLRPRRTARPGPPSSRYPEMAANA